MHKSVLLKESVELLDLKSGDTVVDATLGAGGHSIEILKKIGDAGKLIVFDLDFDAIKDFKVLLKKRGICKQNVVFVNDNFSNIKKVLNDLKIDNVKAVFADLGWRIEQVEKNEYGMSFKSDFLNMNLGQNNNFSAYEVVNQYTVEELCRIFKKYGEEKNAYFIAKLIEKERNIKEIKSARFLAELIKTNVNSYKRHKIHPATKVFQALRIYVNNEFENLENFLMGARDVLVPGGRLAIISFHSLEDRIVKKFFKKSAHSCICPPSFPKCVCGKKDTFKIINKRVIIASSDELAENSRARSAKLRVVEKI